MGYVSGQARVSGGAPFVPGSGGGGDVKTVNGKAPDGAGNVDINAADVGADPTGTAAAAVAAHVVANPAHDVGVITNALDSTGDTMTGALDMDGNAITNASVNGVTLTDAGSSTDSLRADGSYQLASAGSVIYEGPDDTTPTVVAGFGWTTVYTHTTPVIPASAPGGDHTIDWRVLLRSTSGSAFAASETRVLLDLGLGPIQLNEEVATRMASSGVNTGSLGGQTARFTLASAQAITVVIQARETGTGTRSNLRSGFTITRASAS